jgi:hypothetical protein
MRITSALRHGQEIIEKELTEKTKLLCCLIFGELCDFA